VLLGQKEVQASVGSLQSTTALSTSGSTHLFHDLEVPSCQVGGNEGRECDGIGAAKTDTHTNIHTHTICDTNTHTHTHTCFTALKSPLAR